MDAWKTNWFPFGMASWQVRTVSFRETTHMTPTLPLLCSILKPRHFPWTKHHFFITWITSFSTLHRANWSKDISRKPKIIQAWVPSSLDLKPFELLSNKIFPPVFVGGMFFVGTERGMHLCFVFFEIVMEYEMLCSKFNVVKGTCGWSWTKCVYNTSVTYKYNYIYTQYNYMHEETLSGFKSTTLTKRIKQISHQRSKCAPWRSSFLCLWTPKNSRQSSFSHMIIHWVVPLPRMPVTTRKNCIFSRGSRTKPSFATVTGRRDNPNYAWLCNFSRNISKKPSFPLCCRVETLPIADPPALPLQSRSSH